MTDINQATDEFIAALLDSEEYHNYRTELARVKQFPELKAKIDEFRRRNYELQARGDLDFDKLDRFEKEYETFREDIRVADFLAAELDLCKAVQKISMRITDALQFE